MSADKFTERALLFLSSYHPERAPSRGDHAIDIAALLSQVEEETIERAAKHLEKIARGHPSFSISRECLRQGAKAIRALKGDEK